MTSGIAVYVGSSAIGQGIETIFAQIAADALELPMAHIRVLHGSTNLFAGRLRLLRLARDRDGRKRGLVAAENLLENFRAAAAQQLGVPESALTIAEGAARADAAVGQLIGQALGLTPSALAQLPLFVRLVRVSPASRVGMPYDIELAHGR